MKPLLILACALGGFAAAPGAQQSTAPVAWEYKFFSLKDRKWEAQVDSLGQAGWELVSYVDSPRSPMGQLAEPILLVFKRPRSP